MGNELEYGAVRTEVLAVAMIIVGLVTLLFVAAIYVLQGIAMMRMAKKTGVPSGWMGFVPIVDMLLLGRLADVGSMYRTHATRLLITQIITAVLALITQPYNLAMDYAELFGTVPFAVSNTMSTVMGLLSIVFSVASIFLAVYIYLAYYHICKNFGGSNATGWFLGMLFGSLFCSTLVPAILLLILSGKTPAMTENGSVTVQTPPAPPVPPAPPAPPKDDVFQ